jgi:flagellar P-ring protein precursor FlgI
MQELKIQFTSIYAALFSRHVIKLLSYSLVLLISTAVLMITIYFLAAPKAHASSRIKDIVSVEGVRDNMLVGYGLVVGLNGTGDKLKSAEFTQKSLTSFLERLGVKIKGGNTLKTKNVAAVTLTASLPPFARAGSRIDVRVSAMGDASNLQGGVLLASPLMGADGQVYALAQGSVAIEGFGATGGDGSAILKGVPTNGYVPNGAIIEKEIAFDFNTLDQLNLALRNADVSTAGRIASAINKEMKSEIAKVQDPGTVSVAIPENYRDSVTELLAKIEHVMVTPDQVAKIIIDEASGTVVMGENVKIDKIAIAQGNLVVQIKETPVISQPGAFAPEGDGVQTIQTASSNITIDENSDRKLAVMNGGATLSELVAGLNAIGVGPRDLISILQTIKAAGAVQASIESR